MPEETTIHTALSRPPARQSRWNAAWALVADVRPGEGWTLAGASCALAGIVAAHISLETARDALFLTKLSPQRLAFVYIAMALLAALVTRFEVAVERALGRSNALILTLMLSAMGTTIFYVTEKSEAVVFALYLWAGLTGTLLMLQFWLFAATRFSAAQGRRLYGVIAAGGVVGAVGGGGLSALFSRYVDVESLLALAASIQLLAALIITAAPAASHATQSVQAPRMRDAFAALRQNPYVIRLFCLTVVSSAILLITDYLFKSVTAARIPPEQLATFLAAFYTSTNALALIIQLFVATRLLQRVGTIFTLSLLPLAIFLSTGLPLILGGVFGATLAAKAADGSLRHSLHKMSMELLYLPLTQRDRSSAKGLLDTVVSRGTQGVTALLLLALGALNLDSPRNFFAIIAGGAIVWFFIALSLKKPYLNQFRDSLGREADVPKLALDQLSLDGVEVVIESLSDPRDEKRVLSAMILLDGAGRTGLIPALVLYHPNTSVLIKALELIPSRNRKDWPLLAERLVEHEAEGVRLAAVRALGRFGYLEKLKPELFIKPTIRATAAFFQADALEQPLTNSQVLALTKSSADRDAQLALVRSITEHGGQKWADVLLELAKLDAVHLVRALPTAMTRVRDPRFIEALISRLVIRDSRREVRAALAAMGDEAFSALSKLLLSSDTHPRLRLHLPRAISQFKTQKSANFLVKQLEGSLPGVLRFKALRGLGAMVGEPEIRFRKDKILPLVAQNAHKSLEEALLGDLLEAFLTSAPQAAQASGLLLIQLLRDKQQQSVQRTTRLLQLVHQREDLRRVCRAICGEDRAAKTAAGELLEVITLGYQEDLRNLVRALSDPVPTSKRTAHLIALLKLEIHDVNDVLRQILLSPDPALSALSAHFAEKSQIASLTVEVQEVLSNNPWLQGKPPAQPLLRLSELLVL